MVLNLALNGYRDPVVKTEKYCLQTFVDLFQNLMICLSEICTDTSDESFNTVPKVLKTTLKNTLSSTVEHFLFGFNKQKLIDEIGNYTKKDFDLQKILENQEIKFFKSLSDISDNKILFNFISSWFSKNLSAGFSKKIQIITAKEFGFSKGTCSRAANEFNDKNHEIETLRKKSHQKDCKSKQLY
ncbi:hypothetical protein AGLY_007445 [Aphis glycines]|uniref:Uncharacterized protein n=1 Tax=Aphis glycines TaxID=307491 RepID=A0A6G0TMW7_APHGL|nr:hypothetical protein AGLY_007445 [Aphis glycines]